MSRKSKRIKKTASKIIDLSLWLAILGFGLYLGVKLILGLIFYAYDDIMYYGYALTGYVAAIVLIVISCVFMSMIIQEWRKGDDDK